MPICSPAVRGDDRLSSGSDREGPGGGPAHGAGSGPLLFSPEWVGEAASPEWGPEHPYSAAGRCPPSEELWAVVGLSLPLEAVASGAAPPAPARVSISGA